MGNKFFDYYSTVTEGDSALTAREKALIALAVSPANQCSYCIDAYTANSLQSGADEEQMMEAEGRLPDMLVASVGGGSNAIGLFHPFLDDDAVQIVGVEAGGKGLEGDEHCASLTAGSPGVLHGNRTYLLQTSEGQIEEGASISAGLDYPGIGPEHSWLKDSGRVNYVPIMDTEALEAFQLLCRLEGIIPALEPSHALAEVIKRAPTMDKDQIIVMNLCGRGDKDVFTVGEALGVEM